MEWQPPDPPPFPPPVLTGSGSTGRAGAYLRPSQPSWLPGDWVMIGQNAAFVTGLSAACAPIFFQKGLKA